MSLLKKMIKKTKITSLAVRKMSKSIFIFKRFNKIINPKKINICVKTAL